MNNKNKKLFFSIFTIVFYIDIIALTYATYKTENTIFIPEFLILLSFCILVWVYLYFLNFSKKFRDKIISFVTITLNEEVAKKIFNRDIGTISFLIMLIFFAFFVLSVLPSVFGIIQRY
jgi:hypothetical protein